MENELPVGMETELAALGVDLGGPGEHECLFCYLWRMLGLCGCDGLDCTKRYLAARAPRSQGTLRQLEACGGYCDCEIIMNVVTPNDPMWSPGYDGGLDDFEEPEREEKPACHGVEKGAVRPCALWNAWGAFSSASF